MSSSTGLEDAAALVLCVRIGLLSQSLVAAGSVDPPSVTGTSGVGDLERERRGDASSRRTRVVIAAGSGSAPGTAVTQGAAAGAAGVEAASGAAAPPS